MRWWCMSWGVLRRRRGVGRGLGKSGRGVLRGRDIEGCFAVCQGGTIGRGVLGMSVDGCLGALRDGAPRSRGLRPNDKASHLWRPFLAGNDGMSDGSVTG